LSAQLGGPRILIKRDDLTGLAFGGNKTRKLEYLLAAAKAQGATPLITMGGVQSNHCRQTAAAARLGGMACELVLPADEDAAEQGHLLLGRMPRRRAPWEGADRDRVAGMEETAAAVRGEGTVPDLMPAGGSSAVGALGYVAALLERNVQLWEQG